MKVETQTMSRRSFIRSLRRGLGSSIIELKKNSETEEYRNIVMRSCLKCIAYDTQIEGAKGFYLYTAIKTFENQEEFLKSIIEKFQKRLHWQLSEQLYEIICCFANDRYVKAEEGLEKKYCKLKKYLPLICDKDFNRFCERELLEKLMVRKLVNGFDAFKQCVYDMGQMIIKRGGDDCLFYDFFMESAEDIFGKEIYVFLEDAESDPVGRFFQVFKKNSSEENNGSSLKIVTVKDFYQRYKYSHDEVKEERVTIDHLINCAEEFSKEANSGYPMRMRKLSRQFAGQAMGEEFKELARVVIVHSSDFIKASLLIVFEFVDFPLNIDFLLPYLDSDNDNLREITVKVLSRFKDKRLGLCAVQLFNDGQLENAIKLLGANFEIEDEAILRKYTLRSKRVTHGVIKSVTDIYREHKSNTCGDILLHLYKNAKCAHCRYRIVEMMINNEVISENVLIECQYDSYEDTRKLAVASLENRTSDN